MKVGRGSRKEKDEKMPPTNFGGINPPATKGNPRARGLSGVLQCGAKRREGRKRRGKPPQGGQMPIRAAVYFFLRIFPPFRPTFNRLNFTHKSKRTCASKSSEGAKPLTRQCSLVFRRAEKERQTGKRIDIFSEGSLIQSRTDIFTKAV